MSDNPQLPFEEFEVEEPKEPKKKATQITTLVQGRMIVGEEVDDKARAERYQKGCQDLRRKNKDLAIQVKSLKLRVKELEVDAYINTDEAQTAIIDGLRTQVKKLELQLQVRDDTISGLKKENGPLQNSVTSLTNDKTNLTTRVEELEGEVAELKTENTELKEELEARVAEDSRFKNMDL